MNQYNAHAFTDLGTQNIYFKTPLPCINQPQKHVITVMDKGKTFREKLHAKRGKCIENASQELKSTLKQ